MQACFESDGREWIRQHALVPGHFLWLSAAQSHACKQEVPLPDGCLDFRQDSLLHFSQNVPGSQRPLALQGMLAAGLAYLRDLLAGGWKAVQTGSPAATNPPFSS